LKEPGGEPVDCNAVLDAIRCLLQNAGVERQQSSQADAERAMPTAPTEENKLPTGLALAETAGSNPASEADPLQAVVDEDEISQKYLSIFIDESEATLDGLTTSLLAMESGASGDDLKGLMGAVHKIKGSAASIGLNRIAKLSHLMEDLLEDLIDSKGSLSAAMTDVLLKCTDALQQHVTDLKQGTARSDPFGQLAAQRLMLVTCDFSLPSLPPA
jgi:two-component system chemotaxis sensor kinase CheA